MSRPARSSRGKSHRTSSKHTVAPALVGKPPASLGCPLCVLAPPTRPRRRGPAGAAEASSRRLTSTDSRRAAKNRDRARARCPILASTCHGLWRVRRGRRRRLGQERQRGTRRRLYWKHARARRPPPPDARAPRHIDAPPPIRSSRARSPRAAPPSRARSSS